MANAHCLNSASAFFQVGTAQDPAVQPQFVVGPAVVYGFGWWAGGGALAVVLPAVAMGLALMSLGLLVARVVGAWAGVASVVGVAVVGMAWSFRSACAWGWIRTWG